MEAHHWLRAVDHKKKELNIIIPEEMFEHRPCIMPPNQQFKSLLVMRPTHADEQGPYRSSHACTVTINPGTTFAAQYARCADHRKTLPYFLHVEDIERARLDCTSQP